MASKDDYYKILGIDRSATQEEIRKAYFELVKQVHPDRNSAYYAEEVFKGVEEANSVLSDPSKRAEYDLSLSRDDYGTEREESGIDSYEGNIYQAGNQGAPSYPAASGERFRGLIKFYARGWKNIWQIKSLWGSIPLTVLYTPLALVAIVASTVIFFGAVLVLAIILLALKILKLALKIIRYAIKFVLKIIVSILKPPAKFAMRLVLAFIVVAIFIGVIVLLIIKYVL